MQHLRQLAALGAHPAEQLLLHQDLLDREARSAGHRVGHVGIAVLEEARPVADRLADRGRRQHRADRLVTGAEPLGDRDEVGIDAILLAGEQAAGAAHAAHDLVQNQKDAVAVAERADAGEVAGQRRYGAERRPDDRFGDEADDGLGPDPENCILQLAQQPLDISGVGFAGLPVAVGVARADMLGLDQQRLKLFAPPGVAAHREGAERVAVIALAARDEAPPLRLADLEKVLARHLERRLDRLGAAGAEEDLVEPRGRARDQAVGERLGRLVAEEAGMREGELAHLAADRLDDALMAVPETGHGGAAAGVDVALAVAIDDLDAVAANGYRIVLVEPAIENMAHGGSYLTGGIWEQPPDLLSPGRRDQGTRMSAKLARTLVVRLSSRSLTRLRTSS